MTCELFKLYLVDFKNGLLHIINYNDIRDVISAYTRHQPDLKEEKCFISTKLWSFYLHLWEGMGMLEGCWCWGGAKRSQWWCRTCSFPLFFPSFSNSSWNLFLSHFSRIQNLLMPGSSKIKVFLKSASPHSTAPRLLFSLCGEERVWDGEGAWMGQDGWTQLSTCLDFSGWSPSLQVQAKSPTCKQNTRAYDPWNLMPKAKGCFNYWLAFNCCLMPCISWWFPYLDIFWDWSLHKTRVDWQIQ